LAESIKICLNIDQIDRKIIAELLNNGRLNNQELSEKVALSPSPCLRRVRQLENKKIIHGYTAIADQDACGLPITAFVSVRMEKQNQESIEILERGIVALDEVIACYLMSGTSDYLLHVLSPSLKHYESFIRDKLTRIPGMGTVETHFAFGQVKRNQVFPGFT
jgi:Lrp/AsnC family leucine-responsive transcriptional regulator